MNEKPKDDWPKSDGPKDDEQKQDKPEEQPHILEQTYPEFLKWLETDPYRAWAGFHEFAWKLLLSYPPRAFRSLDRETREDIIARIVADAYRDDFRMLRRYEDRGRPFAGWVARIAEHRALDVIRARKRPKPEPAIPRCPHPDEEVSAKELREAVNECCSQLRLFCQTLIKIASDGVPPRDIARTMRIDDITGKKISDSLRACRSQLRKLLVDRGYLPPLTS